MRKFLLAFSFAFLLAVPAQAQIAFVQHNSANQGAGTNSLAFALGNVVAGNEILLVIYGANNTSIITGATCGGSALTNVTRIADASQAMAIEVWHGANVAGGTTACSWTWNVNVAHDVSISEWSGGADSSAVDDFAAQELTGVQTHTGGDITTTQASTLIITASTVITSFSPTAGAGYTALTTTAVTPRMYVQYKIASGIEATNAAWTSGVVEDTVNITAAFKAAAGGGSATVPCSPGIFRSGCG